MADEYDLEELQQKVEGLAREPGPQGKRGRRGDPGKSAAVSFEIQGLQSQLDEAGKLTVTILGETGEQGPQGEQGEQGPQGELGEQGPKGERGPQGDKGLSGRDSRTEGPQGRMGPRGEQGLPGAGLPAGGAVGQVPVKASDDDFDVEWRDAPKGAGEAVSIWNAGRQVTGVAVLFFFQGVTTANENLDAIMERSVILSADLSGSRASARIAAASPTVFLVRKNDVTFNTFTFTGAAGVFGSSAETSFAAGDVLTIKGPATPDAALGDIRVALVGKAT